MPSFPVKWVTPIQVRLWLWSAISMTSRTWNILDRQSIALPVIFNLRHLKCVNARLPSSSHLSSRSQDRDRLICKQINEVNQGNVCAMEWLCLASTNQEQGSWQAKSHSRSSVSMHPDPLQGYLGPDKMLTTIKKRKEKSVVVSRVYPLLAIVARMQKEVIIF